MSTVFGSAEKNHYTVMDEDDDPVMSSLCFLDYRYIRFCFHPLKDKFMVCGDWNDSSWTDVRSIRAGLDSDERSRREQIFGKNQIDIKQKSIPQLLVDEVSRTPWPASSNADTSRPSIPSTFSRYAAWYCGRLTNTTTMRSAFSSSLLCRLPRPFWRRDQ